MGSNLGLGDCVDANVRRRRFPLPDRRFHVSNVVVESLRRGFVCSGSLDEDRSQQNCALENRRIPYRCKLPYPLLWATVASGSNGTLTPELSIKKSGRAGPPAESNEQQREHSKRLLGSASAHIVLCGSRRGTVAKCTHSTTRIS